MKSKTGVVKGTDSDIDGCKVRALRRTDMNNNMSYDCILYIDFPEYKGPMFVQLMDCFIDFSITCIEIKTSKNIVMDSRDK